MSHNIKMVIVVRKDLHMRTGKMCAQVAHAAQAFILESNESDDHLHIDVDLTQDEAQWIESLHTKIVCGCESEDELKQLILAAEVRDIATWPIIDAGLTEFHNVPTLTCVAFGPHISEELDEITGHLKLL